MFDPPVDNSTRIPLTGSRFYRWGGFELRPDEEGIETGEKLLIAQPIPSSNYALMKKGLKLLSSGRLVWLALFELRPDEEGIETHYHDVFLSIRLFELRPDVEGIETGGSGINHNREFVRTTP